MRPLIRGSKIGGSHCDSRPSPLSGQVAILWICGLAEGTNVQCARRSPTESPATSVSLRRFVSLDCAILHIFQELSRPSQSSRLAPSRPRCNTRRAMAQMCYIEKWKLADVLDSAIQLHVSKARIQEHFKMRGNRILENP
jgi:hypothetical protein